MVESQNRQKDGYRTYKSAVKWFLRLACFQHVKRKFLDCGEDFDCKVIVRLINYIYHLDHKHRIGHDGWTDVINKATAFFHEVVFLLV